MELVEGRRSPQRIARGAIPLDEALPIAKQIAEALEAAHEQGIIHRDLKPANIKVRRDGTVKVLDFGLAKAMEPAGGLSRERHRMSPTITTPAMTQAGMILGTAAYMAPEQARGKPVDKRADIWAFGCVLYEMLTGRAAFAGETVADVMASVLQKEPDWSLLPASTPASVQRLLRRCLQKEARGTAFVTAPMPESNWTMRSAVRPDSSDRGPEADTMVTCSAGSRHRGECPRHRATDLESRRAPAGGLRGEPAAHHGLRRHGGATGGVS